MMRAWGSWVLAYATCERVARKREPDTPCIRCAGTGLAEPTREQVDAARALRTRNPDWPAERRRCDVCKGEAMRSMAPEYWVTGNRRRREAARQLGHHAQYPAWPGEMVTFTQQDTTLFSREKDYNPEPTGVGIHIRIRRFPLPVPVVSVVLGRVQRYEGKREPSLVYPGGIEGFSERDDGALGYARMLWLLVVGMEPSARGVPNVRYVLPVDATPLPGVNVRPSLEQREQGFPGNLVRDF